MKKRLPFLLAALLLAMGMALPLHASEPASDRFAQLVQQIVNWVLESEENAPESPQLPCPTCRLEDDPNPVSQPPCPTCHVEKDTP